MEASLIETSHGDEYNDRILQIGKAVEKIMEKFMPNIMAIEKLFFTQNQKTALKVSEVKGIIMYLAAVSSIPCFEFTPLEVKSSVCGYGKADKKQVRDMLRFIFKNYPLPKNDDACDAIAVAYTGMLLVKNRNT